MAIDPEIEERLAWLEAAVSKLAGSSSPPITLPPRPGEEATTVSAEVRQLILDGNTIEASRRHREETGADLADARRAIENADLNYS
jgi:hypothetical protein